MDLTTVERLKAILEITGSSKDALLGQIVTGVSLQAEQFLERHAQEQDRTEQYDLDSGQRLVWLRGYPVDTAQTFTVKNSATRDFASVSALDADQYYLNSRTGRLSFESVLAWGEGVLQVRSTGGLGTTAADALANFPDVALAVELQAAYVYKRREHLGLSGLSLASGASLSFSTKQDWLQEAKELLRRHRRMVEA